VTKILEKSNLKEERFILAHDLRGFSPWPLDLITSDLGEAEHHGEERVMEQMLSS
jgi:hypothetical protein